MFHDPISFFKVLAVKSLYKAVIGRLLFSIFFLIKIKKTVSSFYF